MGGGRGLTGLRGRIGPAGGVPSAGPLPDGGFEVTARLPVRLLSASKLTTGAPGKCPAARSKSEADWLIAVVEAVEQQADGARARAACRRARALPAPAAAATGEHAELD
ncbi:hypothetical protein GCM10025331_38970 [Actinoplanes utahensis]|nr:hypothetical protein Aut01nite_44710 [Actinoplanes utahensis]